MLFETIGFSGSKQTLYRTVGTKGKGFAVKMNIKMCAAHRERPRNVPGVETIDARRRRVVNYNIVSCGCVFPETRSRVSGAPPFTLCRRRRSFENKTIYKTLGRPLKQWPLGRDLLSIKKKKII